VGAQPEQDQQQNKGWNNTAHGHFDEFSY
jgi:hypothetical protein